MEYVTESVEDYLARGGKITKRQMQVSTSKQAARAITLEELGL
jgi:hypothetical protein